MLLYRPLCSPGLPELPGDAPDFSSTPWFLFPPADCLQLQARAHQLGLLAAGLGGSYTPFASLGLRHLFWK